MIYRRRRTHPLIALAAILAAAYYFTDDSLANAYYFDDALTLRYKANDG